jgi:hypothetical protein
VISRRTRSVIIGVLRLEDASTKRSRTTRRRKGIGFVSSFSHDFLYAFASLPTGRPVRRAIPRGRRRRHARGRGRHLFRREFLRSFLLSDRILALSNERGEVRTIPQSKFHNQSSYGQVAACIPPRPSRPDLASLLHLLWCGVGFAKQNNDRPWLRFYVAVDSVGRAGQTPILVRYLDVQHLSTPETTYSTGATRLARSATVRPVKDSCRLCLEAGRGTHEPPNAPSQDPSSHFLLDGSRAPPPHQQSESECAPLTASSAQRRAFMARGSIKAGGKKMTRPRPRPSLSFHRHSCHGRVPVRPKPNPMCSRPRGSMRFASCDRKVAFVLRRS